MRIIACTALLGLSSFGAIAGPWGNDFGLSFNAAAGGQGAATYANPHTASDAIFGNPATMVNFLDKPRTVSFGAAYANIDFRLSHDGTVAGAPFDAKSDTVNFLIPNFGLVGKVGDGFAVGGGFGITAGLASDFRTDTPLGPAISYVAFANNISAAKQLNENWSVGATATMGFALIEVGPVRSAGTANDIGFRGTVGVAYNKDKVAFSAHYTSELKFEFDNAFLITGNEFGDLPLAQPQEVVLGFSYQFGKRWEGQFAYLHKDWSNADGYEDIWNDQNIISAGFQYSTGAWAYRFGLGYSSDLRRQNLGNKFGGNDTLGFAGQTVPLNPAVLEFLQASLAPSFWTTHLSVGLGYTVNDVTQIDFFVASVFGSEEEISVMNQSDVDILQAGAGFTWQF